MWPNPQFPGDLVTFTEEIVNGKLYFLCSEVVYRSHGTRVETQAFCWIFFSSQNQTIHAEPRLKNEMHIN